MTKARTLADNYAADINQVTADAPLTGGGTSGTVTVGIQAGTTAQSGAVQLTDSTASTSTTTAATPNSVKSAYDLANGAVAKSLVDAKGDLLVGSANDTVSRLAVASTAGYVLTVDSAEATGLKWAAAAGGGKVLQVVQGTYATLATNTTSTLADTGLTASITPAATSSKVLVLFSIHGGANHLNNLNETEYALIRGATNIYQARGLYTETGLKKYMTTTGVYLDSPSTTSSTTYKVQFRNINNSDGVYANISTTSTIILMEIGA